MATKVGILDSHQDISAKPAESRKRSYAELLVRRLMADKIGPYLYQRRAIHPATLPREYRVQPRAYIPEKLPANIDYQLGLKLQIPSLAGQVRFRAIADQRSNPAY